MIFNALNIQHISLIRLNHITIGFIIAIGVFCGSKHF